MTATAHRARRRRGGLDQGPGEPAAAVVDGEAALGDERPGPGAQRVALERVEQLGQRVGQRAVEEGAQVVGELGRDAARRRTPR